jgi:hypothetical protein
MKDDQQHFLSLLGHPSGEGSCFTPHLVGFSSWSPNRRAYADIGTQQDRQHLFRAGFAIAKHLRGKSDTPVEDGASSPVMMPTPMA